jgi:hypothetical protein
MCIEGLVIFSILERENLQGKPWVLQGRSHVLEDLVSFANTPRLPCRFTSPG